MSQLTTTSVRDLLPKNCLLKIKDNDFVSLEGITDVDKQFLGMSSLARRKKLHLTASLVMKTVNIVTLRLPQVWITELKINSKRDSLLTMDVALNWLKVLNCCLFCPSPHCHLSIN